MIEVKSSPAIVGDYYKGLNYFKKIYPQSKGVSKGARLDILTFAKVPGLTF